MTASSLWLLHPSPPPLLPWPSYLPVAHEEEGQVVHGAAIAAQLLLEGAG